jgi:hypothetical protein
MLTPEKAQVADAVSPASPFNGTERPLGWLVAARFAGIAEPVPEYIIGSGVEDLAQQERARLRAGATIAAGNTAVSAETATD